MKTVWMVRCTNGEVSLFGSRKKARERLKKIWDDHASNKRMKRLDMLDLTITMFGKKVDEDVVFASAIKEQVK